MELPRLTTEQEAVIGDLQQGRHVVVRAGPGMGKSTLALHVATTFPAAKVTLIVYNRRLKEDTKKRCVRNNIGNLEVHTYHSFARRYFVADCQDNTGVRRAIAPGCVALTPVCFDVLVLDEQQDMTPLYAQLAIKAIRCNTSTGRLQLLVLGDERQSIYDFNYADARFLTLASRAFAPAEPHRSWSERRLTITHRLTKQMAHAVNTLFLGGEQRFVSTRDGEPVRFWLGDVFDTFSLAQEVQRWIDQGRAFDDIMIVAPSVRTSSLLSPVARLENRLVQLGYPVTVTSSDDGPIMADVVHGKILFASFHQTKGTERDCVLVLSADNSYFKYYNPTANRMACPNPVFVAITRARCELTMVVNREHGFMPFINQDILRRPDPNWRIIEGAQCPRKVPSLSAALTLERRWSVTDLVRHQPDELIDALMQRLTWLPSESHGQRVNVPSTFRCANGLVEQVSDLVGIAVPALHELRLKGRCGVMDHVLSEFECRAHDEHVSIIDAAFASGGQCTPLTNQHSLLNLPKNANPVARRMTLSLNVPWFQRYGTTILKRRSTATMWTYSSPQRTG